MVMLTLIKILRFEIGELRFMVASTVLMLSRGVLLP